MMNWQEHLSWSQAAILAIVLLFLLGISGIVLNSVWKERQRRRLKRIRREGQFIPSWDLHRGRKGFFQR